MPQYVRGPFRPMPRTTVQSQRSWLMLVVIGVALFSLGLIFMLTWM